MSFRSPVAVEGLPLIAGFVAVAAVGSSFCPWVVGDVPLWLAAGWCVWFFRDPPRRTPSGAGLVVAPADGRVVAIEEVAAAPLSGDPARKLSIFMNVFDVHVNRFPESGRVEKVVYHRGRFFNAALDKASEQNERMEILLALENGTRLPIVQVAGLVARRIICRLSEGMGLKRGERFGLIRFGSRVDVYLPLTARVAVILGDKTCGGETVIAYLEGGG